MGWKWNLFTITLRANVLDTTIARVIDTHQIHAAPYCQTASNKSLIHLCDSEFSDPGPCAMMTHESDTKTIFYFHFTLIQTLSNTIVFASKYLFVLYSILERIVQLPKCNGLAIIPLLHTKHWQYYGIHLIWAELSWRANVCNFNEKFNIMLIGFSILKLVSAVMRAKRSYIYCRANK